MRRESATAQTISASVEAHSDHAIVEEVRLPVGIAAGACLASNLRLLLRCRAGTPRPRTGPNSTLMRRAPARPPVLPLVCALPDSGFGRHADPLPALANDVAQQGPEHGGVTEPNIARHLA